jgi:hypothetical protein
MGHFTSVRAKIVLLVAYRLAKDLMAPVANMFSCPKIITHSVTYFFISESLLNSCPALE